MGKRVKEGQERREKSYYPEIEKVDTMVKKKQYLVAVKDKKKAEIFAFKTKKDRAGFVKELKKNKFDYATSER